MRNSLLAAATANTPVPVRIDDLQAIKGIGQVREQRIYELGILTYAQLAAGDASSVAKQVGRMVSVKKVRGWQAQARVKAGV